MTKVHGRSFAAARARGFRNALLKWFEMNKRDLPWRRDTDAYRVWVSEIMLQQTRVAVVVGYYERFLQSFPNVRALALTEEADVLAAWSGLGYYRRARALRAGAKIIFEDRGGVFPTNASEWEKLPGIGRYTAAAIASIAFGEPCAVVDGNVVRVLERVSGNAKLSLESAWAMAGELLSRKDPGEFNQAMMELGATICVPGQPNCLVCPVAKWCETRGAHAREHKEIRKRKRIACLLCRSGSRVYLVQRGARKSQMPSMWELPQAQNVDGRDVLLTLRHSITDTDFSVDVVAGTKLDASDGRWMRAAELDRIPLTGLARKILRRLEVI